MKCATCNNSASWNSSWCGPCADRLRRIEELQRLRDAIVDDGAIAEAVRHLLQNEIDREW